MMFILYMFLYRYDLGGILVEMIDLVSILIKHKFNNGTVDLLGMRQGKDKLNTSMYNGLSS